MSDYRIIEKITLKLRHRIAEACQEADLTSIQESAISLTLPNNDNSGNALLSLYLYHIEVDGHLRNQHLLPANNSDLRFPPIPLQLRYLITPLDKKKSVSSDQDQNRHEVEKHSILGRILQHFHERPFIETLDDITPLDNSFGGNSNEVRITFEPLTMEQISQIWSALNTDYRLSIAYNVRVVTIDSAEGPTKAHRVTEVQTVVGHKGN